MADSFILLRAFREAKPHRKIAGVSFIVAVNASQPCLIPPRPKRFPPHPPCYLAHVLDPAAVEQIGEMDHERALLPDDLNQSSLRLWR